MLKQVIYPVLSAPPNSMIRLISIQYSTYTMYLYTWLLLSASLLIRR